jgi:hypothetical protein
MVVLLVAGLSAPLATFAKGVPTTDFRPDPKSVQRYGPAYRYPQAGWIVLHIEGKPYQRGYQHGRLMAPEIAAHLRCFAATQSPEAPDEGWKLTRTLANALFLRRYHKEYLEEMKGIAAGATAAGARFENRAIDLLDIVALNAWPEIDTLDGALEATAHGLEGRRFLEQPRPMPKPKPMRCSAFAATGPATADGKIVFGHITMFGLYPSLFYNVWLDVKPEKGHRVLMQSYPGGIQSGLDYYMNDAGLLVCETTIAQTKFNIKGLTVASRIRQALQYGDSIDKAVAILQKDNNGLYTNEWLLADTKTNEIAMFELGTHKSKLWRSSKGEWFGGTEGFYWGCNNTKDLQVRLETLADVTDRPANMVFRPSDRDKAWLKLFAQYKGKIDADFGKIAFTTPPIAAYQSVDAKFTTTAMAKELKTWALFGPPLGRTVRPTRNERKLYPEIRPLVSNPWTVLHAQAPAREKLTGPAVVDLKYHSTSSEEDTTTKRRRRQSEPVAAWHGTLIPKTDADTWLAAAFADYEKIYAQEKAFKKENGSDGLSADHRDRLAVQLYTYRSQYLTAVRAATEMPLAKTRSALTSDAWYWQAAGKGVLLLHELRKNMGDAVFEEAMLSFGKENAGKAVTAAQFQAHMEKASGKALKDFFTCWLEQPGLTKLELAGAAVRNRTSANGQGNGTGYQVEGEIRRRGPRTCTQVEVVVKTAEDEVTKQVVLNGEVTPFVIHTEHAPLRVYVDRYNRTAKAQGGVFSTLSYYQELEHALIVYGTDDEVSTNREGAKALQDAILQRWANYTVPIKSAKEVTEKDLKARHLLLIGRPDCNSIVERCRKVLPITFGSRSFVVRDKSYAHARSAVIAVGENPWNKRFSVVVMAGLSAEATLRAAPLLARSEQPPAEVLVLAHGEGTRALVLPARELVCDLEKR